jgi:hypothetical protein
MDNSQMNEPPLEDTKSTGKAKAPGFVAQFGLTGQKQSLWAGACGHQAAGAGDLQGGS